jgi:hypothetical protein
MEILQPYKLPYRTDLVALLVFLTTPRYGPRTNTPFPKVPLLLRVDSLLRERVYRTVSQKLPWYILISHGRCMETALHFVITGKMWCKRGAKLVPCSWIFLPWRWRRYFPPKRRFTQYLHGATSQKTAFFIVTAMKTTNLTRPISLKFFLNAHNSHHSARNQIIPKYIHIATTGTKTELRKIEIEERTTHQLKF